LDNSSFPLNGKIERCHNRFKAAHSASAFPLTLPRIFLCLLLVGIGQPNNVQSQCKYSDSLNAQIPDYFQGDLSLFGIENAALQSQSTNTNPHSYELRVPFQAPVDSILWEFNLELNLNTSSSNRFCFGFTLTNGSEAYFQIGNTKDQMQFIQTPKDTLMGAEKIFDRTKNHYHIQLIKNTSYLLLKLFPQIPDTPFCYKIEIRQSAINGLFYRIFQNGKTAIGTHRISQFKVCTLPLKSQPLKLVQAQIINAQRIQLQFNHPIEFPNLADISIFENAPNTINYNNDYQQLHVNFNHPLNDSVFISLRNIRSRQNEYLDTQFWIPIDYPKNPIYGDLRFSEVHYDAVPSYGSLPETEYIELHKTSKSDINLKGTEITINSNKFLFPEYVWDTLDYVILSPKCRDYSVIPCIDIPFNLLNAENTLTLYSPNQALLDSITLHYEQQNPVYYSGGVSLEAPESPSAFSNASEWYSNAKQGGSPGSPPQILQRSRPRNTSLIASAVFIKPFIHIELTENLKPQQWIYIVHGAIKDSTFYRSGQQITFNGLSNVDSCTLHFYNRHQNLKTLQCPLFSLGYSPIEITEIWFEATENSDFIEVFNSGKHAIALNDLDILIYDLNNRLQVIIPCFTSPRKWLMPGEFFVFTQNPYFIISQIDSINPNQIMALSTFPNLKSEGGSVEIVHHLYGRLDKAPFNRDMHSQTVTTLRSLEKKALGLSSNNSQNWMSYLNLNQPSSPSFGTYPKLQPPSKKFIEIDRRIWIINGLEPRLNLSFAFPNNGYYMNIYLFDAWGNPLGPIHTGLQMPQTGVYPLLLEEFPRIYQSGNYVLKFEALHIGDQQRITQTERISFHYDK
jgi:hypothetical protein